MNKLSLDEKSVYLFTDRLTRKYLSGVDVAEGFLIVHNGGAICLTDARYYYAAKQDFAAVGIETVKYGGIETLSQTIKSLNKENLLIDFTKETVKDYQDYIEFGLNVLDCSIELSKIRAVKTQSEIEKIKKACTIAEKAFYQGIKNLKVGVSENQIKVEIENAIKEFGGDGASFDIIVAFGKNAAVPHHVTGETVLENDQCVLVDMGAIVDGYMSDLTRTVFFGKPDQKFIDCYEAVKRANELAQAQITSGMTTNQADAVSRSFLQSKGLAEYFTHSLGHGVGLEIHEFPTLSPKRADELKENFVFTIEPGVYFDGQFGIRIEDTVVIKNGKIERLFADSKELLIL